MKKSVNITVFAIALAILGMQGACTSGQKENKTTAVDQTEPKAAEANTAVDEKAIQLEANDQMQYNLQEIEVKAGEEVTLVLKHVGKMDKNVMGHNFVILKKDTDVAAFIQKAALAKDNDYIPADEADNVLAHTKTIGGGETTTIKFTVPEKGTYDFLCTFPAHAALMKGKLIAN